MLPYSITPVTTRPSARPPRPQDDLSRCQRKSAPDSSLQAIQFTCINIAAKIVAHSPSSDMHRYMLGKVRGAWQRLTC